MDMSTTRQLLNRGRGGRGDLVGGHLRMPLDEPGVAIMNLTTLT